MARRFVLLEMREDRYSRACALISQLGRPEPEHAFIGVPRFIRLDEAREKIAAEVCKADVARRGQECPAMLPGRSCLIQLRDGQLSCEFWRGRDILRTTDAALDVIFGEEGKDG